MHIFIPAWLLWLGLGYLAGSFIENFRWKLRIHKWSNTPEGGEKSQHYEKD